MCVYIYIYVLYNRNGIIEYTHFCTFFYLTICLGARSALNIAVKYFITWGSIIYSTGPWKGAECVTPKYATLACGLSWMEDNQDATEFRKTYFFPHYLKESRWGPGPERAITKDRFCLNDLSLWQGKHPNFQTSASLTVPWPTIPLPSSRWLISFNCPTCSSRLLLWDSGTYKIKFLLCYSVLCPLGYYLL